MPSTGQRRWCNILTVQSSIFDIHTKHNSVYFQLFPLKQVMRWKARFWVGGCLGKLTVAILTPMLAHHLKKNRKWCSWEVVPDQIGFQSSTVTGRVREGVGGVARLAWLIGEGLAVVGNSYGSNLRVLHTLHWGLELVVVSSWGLEKALWITHEAEGLWLKQCRPVSEMQVQIGKVEKGMLRLYVSLDLTACPQYCFSPNKQTNTYQRW